MSTFQQDAEHCAKYTEVLTLEEGPRRLLVSPKLQGRVLTSSAEGPEGLSFGWINRDYLAAGKMHHAFNPYGGEDRVWVAPEGGQFGFHFEPGAPFTVEASRVPKPLDREPFEVFTSGKRSVTFRKDFELVNRAGTRFHVLIERKVSLLDQEETFVDLGVGHEGLRWVGFESQHTISNKGTLPWKKETGLPALWCIGMFSATDRSVVVLPYKDVPTLPNEKIAVPVFGEIPQDRLQVGTSAVLFKGDSRFRSKVALHARRAKSVVGSWDPTQGVLTVVSFNLPQGPHPYVSSLWEIQKEPFNGDVVSSYNDGPAAPGEPSWGPYYELETTSPAAELMPGGNLTHENRTFHFMGERERLDAMSKHLFGVSLDDIEAFGAR